MKKMFSQFKRFSILLLVVMCSSVMYGATFYSKPKVSVSAEPATGAGTVYVSVDGGTPSSSATPDEYSDGAETGDETTFNLTAEHTSADYLWYGWFSKTNLRITDKNATLNLSCSDEDNNTYGHEGNVTDKSESNEYWYSYNYPFTAKWVQPDLTGVTGGTANGTRQSTYNFGTITNLVAQTTNIAFSLSNDYTGLLDINNVNPDYYSIATPLNSDGFTNAALSHTKGSSSLTVPVTYTPTGIHGQANTASLTVKSNYPSSGTNCWTAAFSVTEDYTPVFSLSTSSYNFTPYYPIDNGIPSSAYPLPITGRNYAASNIAEWDVSWSDVTYAGGTYPNTNPYSIDTTDPNNPTVTFTAPATGNYTDVTVTLTITAKYRDADGKLVSSASRTITFSADAGNILKIGDLSAYTMDFGIVDFGTAVSKEVALISTYSDLTETRSNEVAGITFTPDYANDKITVSIANTTAIGSHTPSLTLKAGTKASAVLNVTAQVKLAKPVVTATTGLGQAIQLTWQAVTGATSYIVKSEGTVLATIGDDEPLARTYTVTSINGNSLSTSVSYPFTVTAVYNTEDHFGSRISEVVNAQPTAPATITSTDIATLDIYTGTEKFTEGHSTYGKYPYRQKRKIDLSAAFNEGVAAFDKLYIFGLTTGDADNIITKPNASNNSNAVTPCYIYTKSGDNYTLSTTIPNVNIATKPTEFNITDMSNSYYFTGYAPYASCGSTWEENAVFLFTDGNGSSVNLYFDNLELYARPKAEVGTKVPVKKYTVNNPEEAMNMYDDPDAKVIIYPLALEVYLQGTGSVFAFANTSSSKTFQPTIHLSGTTLLESTAGATVHVTSTLLSMDASAGQNSSPIQVLNKKDGTSSAKTTITLTDVWHGTNRTNGILNLANQDSRPAPTIDLGNANTTLNFEGGQYFLSNAGNTSTEYTVTYAISYRMKTMAADKAKMYGLGSDQPGGKVRFKDGSFNCAELPAQYFDENLYHNRTSMKCPQDTKIDGGTFNCDVLSCTSTTSKGGSPTNTNGDALCKVTIPIASMNSNCTATLASDWMTYAHNNGANTADLGYYGIESLTPTTIQDELDNDQQVVHLMLPSDEICFVEVVRTPWVFCMPPVKIEVTGAQQNVGGSKEVISSVAEGDEGLISIQETSRLFYGEIDDFMNDAVASYTSPGGLGVELTGERSEYITNTASYVIKDKIYWVRPIVANEWQMFVPPFDVANVYIIESYPEAQILEDFGDGKTISEDNIYNARIEQAKRTLDLIYNWIYECDPIALGNDVDLWHKDKTKLSPFVSDWIDYEIAHHGESHKPSIDQLYHFTGNNWDANYYLYESSGTWDYQYDSEAAKYVFKTDWAPVTTQSVPRTTGDPQTIMRKGGIYSYCFPYSIYNNGSHKPDAGWDYWTSKYIIMEGYPTEDVEVIGEAQVISGTETDWDGNALSSTIMADFNDADKASLRGNHTFGQVKVHKTNAFYLNGTNRYTNNTNQQTLEPGQGFLLANAGTVPLSMPNKKASIDLMSGVVTYEPGDGSENTVTGTPTISGEREMLVYTLAGGLGVVPVVPQHVSIYNAAGQLVVSQYLTDDTQFALPTGIYLVRGEKDQAKAMVK